MWSKQYPNQNLGIIQKGIFKTLKKDNKSVFEPRGFSKSSKISKIYEKSMHIRSTKYFRMNKLFFSHEFGFRNGYSTNHALTSLTEMTRKALDENKFPSGV